MMENAFWIDETKLNSFGRSGKQFVPQPQGQI